MKVNSNKQWPQWFSTICACLGMFCCGLGFGWTSPSIALLQSSSSPIPISSSEASWIASLLQLGSAFGPFSGALICKYYGPKFCILVSIIPYVSGFALIIVAESAGVLCVSRVITGFAVGLSYSSTPIYISEISEKRNRGSLMIIFSIMLHVGMVFVSGVAPYVSLKVMGGIMLAFPALMITLFFAPESPLFFMRIEQQTKALNSLRLLRRQNDTEILQKELNSMKMNTVQNMKLIDCLKEFVIGSNLKAFGIVFLTIITQQLSGAIPSMLYLESIYETTGMDFPPSIAVLLTLLLTLGLTFVSILLPDKIGRKPLLLGSTLGCMISNAMLGTYYVLDNRGEDIPHLSVLAIVAINTLQISAGLGLNSMPYTIAGEIFSANVKEVAMCLISVVGAILGFMTSKLFQVISEDLGNDTMFLSLMSILILFFTLIFLFVPETSGKSFNEIQELLKNSAFFIKQKTTSESTQNIYDPNMEKRF